MTIWSAEVKELETLYTSIKGRFPESEKELVQLIETKDANVVLLYSRRCLEVIITDLCESELKRPRKTEPLKGIIDKLHHEEKIPSHIIASMQNLNTLSTFGAHPKEFDPEQVKPVLSNLTIIIKWYLKYKDTKIDVKAEAEEVKDETKTPEESTKQIQKPKKKLILLLSGLALVVILVIVALFVFNIIGGRELEKSIAVLPFRNFSAAPDQEYMCDGLTDEIINHLYKIESFDKVVSLTSVLTYKEHSKRIPEIANELKVNYILEGTYKKVGEQITVTAQLIEPKSDKHIWQNEYDQPYKEIIAIQRDIALQIADHLKVYLTDSEKQNIQIVPTTNQLAYDFYLKGNDYWSRFEALLAIDMYSKAIKEDSLFAEAYAQRALMHGCIFFVKEGIWKDHDLLAMEDLRKGKEINPDLHQVKFTEAAFYYWLDRDYDKSLKILKELKAEAPNMADLYAFSSYNLRRQGKLEESISELKEAMELDPFNANYIHNLAGTYENLHQYDNQIECCKQGLSLIPDYIGFNNTLFRAYLAKTGDLMVALKESGLKEEDVQYQVYYYTRQFDRLIEYINKEYTIVSNQNFLRPKTYELAFIYYLNGNTSLSKLYSDSTIIFLKEKIKEIPDDARFYSTLGKCYAFSGNVKEAIECGIKATDLMPVKLDAVLNVNKEYELMEIYLLTGNYELALDKIEFQLSNPCEFMSIGDLMINPIYDNLRSLPRFQKIINSAQE